MNRRRLLTGIVGSFSLVALAGVAFPFLKSLFPSFRREIILDLDLADMRPGDYRKVRWLGRTVYVVRREDSIESELRSIDDDREDAMSERSNQPEFATNRFRSREPAHLLVFANCTHLGCEVEVIEDDGFKGFRCPCHRSDFDAAGRVEKGSPAKLNLEVPEYEYAGRSVIRLLDVDV